MTTPAEDVMKNGVLRRFGLQRQGSALIGGSLVMLIGSGLVSAINFGYNVAVAHLLGPAEFGQAAAAVTLLMLVSCITLAFQLVCAKFVAKNKTDGQRSAVYRMLMRRSWYVGIGIGALLMIGSGVVADYLRLPSPSLVLLLSLGITFYIPLGVKRGGLQGICSFRLLAGNFVLEALTRFLAAIVLIQLGQGVLGAVGAISLAVILAYFLPLTPEQLEARPENGLPASFREGMQAIIFFVGQVIINNVDIVLVKHFFEATLAGIYAAIALVGRVLYFFSWSVVSAMFPISAGASTKDEPPTVLAVPLILVSIITVGFTVGVGVFSDTILHIIFGASFQTAGRGLDSLLMLYAAATGLYALSVVLMAYEMSRKLANTGWIQLAFSGAIIVGITLFHSSLRQVIEVQLVLMVLLLTTCALPFFRPRRALHTATARPLAAISDLLPQATVSEEIAPARTMKRIRRVPEAEVIAEFLKNEFYQSEFHRDRQRFERWVRNPDLNNEAENALRRALLFRRRETMWRELPPDTEWWEVELTNEDLDRLRVFPRAQWRRIANGSFRLFDVIERIENGWFRPGSRTAAFVSKLMELSARLLFEDDNTAVLLIGIDEHQPLTIIEGNHRMTAAALASRSIALRRFRLLCGFSPRMSECCWYQTNLTTLWRYARNRIKVITYDREAEITRILAMQADQSAEEPAQSDSEQLDQGGDFVRRVS